jgi:hypothetical protein
MSITNFIAKKLINYQSENSFAFKMRKKRAERIKDLITECYKENGSVKIIDVGGLEVYWKIIPRQFLLDNKVQITCVNLPGSAIACKNDEIFTYVDGDGCNLVGFADKTFHLSHSNSVIEHVGDKTNTQNFAKEVMRVADKVYLQTPNFWFPMEPHFMTPFFHWLPKEVRIKLLMNFNLGWYKKTSSYEAAKSHIEHCNLLTAKDLKKLFPGSVLYYEKIFFFTKSLIVIKK